MDLDHLRQNIADELSSHGMLALEINNRTIETAIREGVDKVAPWYEERYVETVAVVSGAEDTVYIDLTQLTYLVDHVITVWVTKLDYTGLSTLTNQILGIELLGIYLGEVEELAQWKMLLPMLRKLWEHNIDSMPVDNKLYLHGRLHDSKATVEYARKVEKIEDIGEQKALNWVRDWALAKSKRILGGMRSKYRGGGLNFETDGIDLVQEGNEKMRELEEALKTLHFNYCVMR